MSSPIFQCNSLKGRYPGLNLDEVEEDHKICVCSEHMYQHEWPHGPCSLLTVKFNAYQVNQIWNQRASISVISA